MTAPLLARFALTLLIAFGCQKKQDDAAAGAEPEKAGAAAGHARPAEAAPAAAGPSSVNVNGAPATSAPAAEPGPGAKAAGATQTYERRCSVCHGGDGEGDGPGAAALKPPPRSFADAQWQKSVTDQYIADIIVKGGAAMNKSRAMPANADLANDSELLQALVKKVRAFKK